MYEEDQAFPDSGPSDSGRHAGSPLADGPLVCRGGGAMSLRPLPSQEKASAGVSRLGTGRRGAKGPCPPSQGMLSTS